MVYDGSLPDAMISESLLNSIPCTDAPGTTLLDTRQRECDLPILLQQMDDYHQLSEHRVNVARIAFAAEERSRAEASSATPPIVNAAFPAESQASAAQDASA
jgi:hypothetical protein